MAAILVAIVLAFANQPTSELRASNEIQMARLKSSSASIDAPGAAKPVMTAVSAADRSLK